MPPDRGVGKSRRLMEDEFAEHAIKPLSNMSIKEVFRTGGDLRNPRRGGHLRDDDVWAGLGDSVGSVDDAMIHSCQPKEAALGADVMAPTLREPVRVKIPPGSRAESKLRLKGKGLPTATGGHGDLFLNLQITLPPVVSDEERALYEQFKRIPRPDPRAELLAAAQRG